MKYGINVWLAWLLRMERPGKNLESIHSHSTNNNNNGRDIKLELHEYTNLASRSLMSNIRDEDDYSLPSSPQLNGNDPRSGKKVSKKLISQIGKTETFHVLWGWFSIRMHRYAECIV